MTIEILSNETEHEVRNSINKKRRKGGRPRLLNEELRAYSVRPGFNEAEFAKLEDRAEAAGLEIPEFIRRLALNKAFYALPAINKTALAELSRIGNNVNQIARAIKLNGNGNAIATQQTLTQLQNHLNTIALQLSVSADSEA